MHLRLPKPLHGWRAFAGEVGIVVLGVLIALGAGQLVETAHWHSESNAFLKSVSIEMANSLAAYRYRVEQEPCVQRRLRELNRWVVSDRAGRPVTFDGEIGRPSLYAFRMSVWKSSSSDVMNHLPMKSRQTFSTLYDELDNANNETDQEEEAWRNLNAFNGPPRLTDDARLRVRELIYRAKSVDEMIMFNYSALLSDAAAAGIHPDWGGEKKHVERPDPEFCKPLFTQS